jgi:hypothetical protein
VVRLSSKVLSGFVPYTFPSTRCPPFLLGIRKLCLVTHTTRRRGSAIASLGPSNCSLGKP